MGREWERDTGTAATIADTLLAGVRCLRGDDATVLVMPPPTIRLLLHLQLKHPPIAIRRPDFICPDLVHPGVIQFQMTTRFVRSASAIFGRYTIMWHRINLNLTLGAGGEWEGGLSLLTCSTLACSHPPPAVLCWALLTFVLFGKQPWGSLIFTESSPALQRSKDLGLSFRYVHACTFFLTSLNQPQATRQQSNQSYSYE